MQKRLKGVKGMSEKKLQGRVCELRFPGGEIVMIKVDLGFGRTRQFWSTTANIGGVNKIVCPKTWEVLIRGKDGIFVSTGRLIGKRNREDIAVMFGFEKPEKPKRGSAAKEVVMVGRTGQGEYCLGFSY